MRATARLPKWPTLEFERSVDGIVCGVDEAGYAPIAGPLVAAAVVLPTGPKPRRLQGLTDSKLLSPAARARYFDIIQEVGEVGVGVASVSEIDSLNILRADMCAMRRAVEALGVAPESALVDGRAAPPLACSVLTVVKGDRRCLSIAAASVVAKVVRDRLMKELAADFPGYGWDANVGYGTDRHYLGLLRKGPTEHHRRSFAPLTTLFGRDREALAGLRFGCLERASDLSRVRLVQLRKDLFAVFEGGRQHIGVLKRLGGRWGFQAVGYDGSGEPVSGAGPCAAWHGAPVCAPEHSALVRLFSAPSLA